MMACNDMQVANEALAEWKSEQLPHKRHRQFGAKMYFVRLQISHLYESLKIIDQIRGDRQLMKLVDQCDAKTQQSFQELEAFLPNGAKRQWLDRMVGKLRHNLVFHYDESGKLIERAIADRAARAEAWHSSVTRGSAAYLWHFKPADDILDSIVVRQIWGVPRQQDMRTEVDRIVDEIHQVFLSFVDFSGEFIWKYCSRG
jgi:hypothetical protein